MRRERRGVLVDEERTRITPDPPPFEARPVLRQRWDDLASFHWRYPADVVQALLPPGLTVDTFDGDAWVGLIPFHMPRAPIVGVARAMFSLPYCWGPARHTVDRAADGSEHHAYVYRRRWPRSTAGEVAPHASISYTVGARVPDAEVGELDHFVSARWSLFTVRRGRIVRGDVDHERWPVHHVHDVRIDSTLVEAAGLPMPVGEPHSLASPGVGVQVAWLRRVEP